MHLTKLSRALSRMVLALGLTCASASAQDGGARVREVAKFIEVEDIPKLEAALEGLPLDDDGRRSLVQHALGQGKARSLKLLLGRGGFAAAARVSEFTRQSRVNESCLFLSLASESVDQGAQDQMAEMLLGIGADPRCVGGVRLQHLETRDPKTKQRIVRRFEDLLRRADRIDAADRGEFFFLTESGCRRNPKSFGSIKYSMRRRFDECSGNVDPRIRSFSCSRGGIGPGPERVEVLGAESREACEKRLTEVRKNGPEALKAWDLANPLLHAFRSPP